jgi:DUF177 domain-containing protein
MSVRFVIDSFDFVRNGRIHHGKISPAEFSRLQSYLFDREGELIFTISGLFDENYKPILQILIQGEINLCCQRCLGKLAHTLDLQTNLLLANDEDELGQHDEDDAIDCILATSDMDVMMLIEDEIILSLSISSRHQENECSIDSNLTVDKEPSAHPFAKLAGLKKTH